MEMPQWLDGENILKSIKADSKKRRALPIEFFQKFLRDIWMDNTDEEAMTQWMVKVDQAPWYADDALDCINAVIADPPPHLVELMEENGWIILSHEPDESGKEVPYTYEEYLEWLKQMRDKFRSVYDAAPSELSKDK